MAAGDTGRMVRAATNRIVFAQKLVTTGKTQSGATFTAKLVSKDTGAFATIAGTVTELGSTGIYYVDLTASESDGRHLFCRFVCSDANNVDTELQFIMEAGLNSGMAQSGTASTIRLATTASSTDDYYNDACVEIVRGTGAGQVRTITDYTGSTTTATVSPNWTTNPASDSVYVVHARRDGIYTGNGYQDVNVEKIDASATAAELLKKLYDSGLIASSVNDVTPTTTEFTGAAGLSSTNDFYSSLGSMLVFTSGTLKGIANRITDYDGATLTFSFSTAWPVAPANGDTFVILGHVE